MKDYKQLEEDMKQNPELAKKIEEVHRSLRKNYNTSLISALADLGYTVTEADLSEKTHSGKLDEEALSDVSGGMFWQGDDAPDGHEIGCLLGLFYYMTRKDYCPHFKGHHDFSSGDLKTEPDSSGKLVMRRYCKCGAYETID